MKNSILFRKNGCYELITGQGLVKIPSHTHKSFTVIKIDKGSLGISINDVIMEVSDDDVIVLPPDNSLSFEPESIFSYTSLVIHEPVCTELSELSVTPSVFKDDGSFKKLTDSFDSTEPLEFKNALLLFLKMRAKSFENKDEVLDIVKKAVFYIDTHAEDELSIKQLAEVLNVSDGYLSRAFKKAMHVTPKQYQVQTRLRLAKRSLENDRDDIETAYDSGFASQSHLCSTFKKYMGITMGDYRKNKN
ncbi:MAG: helix-turn-helix domain-containing protein [Succinivibrio sp.]